MEGALLDIMITGTGFVGSNAARKFIDEGYSVVALDLHPQSPDYLEGLGEKLKIEKRDVTSFSALEETVEKEKPTILVHTATYLNPTESFKVFEVNVRGTAIALELARKYDLTLVYLTPGPSTGNWKEIRTLTKAKSLVQSFRRGNLIMLPEQGTPCQSGWEKNGSPCIKPSTVFEFQL